MAVAIPPAATSTRTSHVAMGNGAGGAESAARGPTRIACAPSLSSRAAISDSGQCGIQRSDHQPGSRRTKERHDELDIVGTDQANRVPSAQPCAAEAGGHVVDQGGEGTIGQRVSDPPSGQAPALPDDRLPADRADRPIL